MTPAQIVNDVRDRTRRLYGEYVAIKGTLGTLQALQSISATPYVAPVFVDEMGVTVEGDLTAAEFNDGLNAITTLLASADAELPKLAKLL